MKQLCTVIIVVLFSLAASCYAEDGNAKDYIKILKKYDVPEASRTSTTASDFWNALWRNNENLAEYFEAVKNKKSVAVTSLQRMAECSAMAEPYYRSLYYLTDTTTVGLISYIENELDIKSQGERANIHIIEDDELNAFALPDGRMFIQTGLLYTPGVQIEGLIGVCAHEFTHFLLQHAATHCYRTEKRDRRNKIAAGITAAVNVAAAGYAASQGVDTDWEAVNKTTENLALSAFEDTKRFRYRYSREEELEADIAAFRFLECIGIGGKHYIDMLQLLKDNDIYNGAYVPDDSDHPSLDFRIGLLKYLSDHLEFQRNMPKKTFDDIK